MFRNVTDAIYFYIHSYSKHVHVTFIEFKTIILHRGQLWAYNFSYEYFHLVIMK